MAGLILLLVVIWWNRKQLRDLREKRENFGKNIRSREGSNIKFSS